MQLASCHPPPHYNLLDIVQVDQPEKLISKRPLNLLLPAAATPPVSFVLLIPTLLDPSVIINSSFCRCHCHVHFVRNCLSYHSPNVCNVIEERQSDRRPGWHKIAVQPYPSHAQNEQSDPPVCEHLDILRIPPGFVGFDAVLNRAT